MSLVVSLAGCADLGTSQLASITLSPSTATVGINQIQSFTAIGRNTAGTLVSVSPTWSVTGGIGTINQSGLFTAGSTTGEGYVIASCEGISASAKVTVTDKGWITGTVKNQSGEKVANLKVYLTQNSTLSAYSDSSGSYTISSVPAGTHEVKTQETLLYLATTAETTVGSGESKTLNITLNPRLQISNINVTTTTFVQINYTITNAGTTEAKEIVVAYTIYNKDNQVATAGTDAVGNLSAGASKNSIIYAAGVSSGNYGSYKLTAAAKSF